MNNTAHSAIRAAALDADSIGPVVSRWQTVAELRATVPAMPVVLHDVGPVSCWGTTTYLDVRLRDGFVRLGSLHDNEAEQDRNDRGYTYCIKLPADMTGRELADALKTVEAMMPEVVAGYGEDNEEGMEGFAGLTTDESARVLRCIHMLLSRQRVAAEKDVSFELSPTTDVDELLARRPALTPFRTAIQQMVEEGYVGFYSAVLDYDEPLDANGHLVSRGDRVDAMLIDHMGYVAIAASGDLLWYEADNIGAALEAFHAGVREAA